MEFLAKKFKSICTVCTCSTVQIGRLAVIFVCDVCHFIHYFLIAFKFLLAVIECKLLNGLA